MFSNKPHPRSVAAPVPARGAPGAFLLAIFTPAAAAQREDPDPVRNLRVTDRMGKSLPATVDPSASFWGGPTKGTRYIFNLSAPSIQCHGEYGRAQQVTTRTYSELPAPGETYTLSDHFCRGRNGNGCASPQYVSANTFLPLGDDDDVLSLRVSRVGTTTLDLRWTAPADTNYRDDYYQCKLCSDASYSGDCGSLEGHRSAARQADGGIGLRRSGPRLSIGAEHRRHLGAVGVNQRDGQTFDDGEPSHRRAYDLGNGVDGLDADGARGPSPTPTGSAASTFGGSGSKSRAMARRTTIQARGTRHTGWSPTTWVGRSGSAPASPTTTATAKCGPARRSL